MTTNSELSTDEDCELIHKLFEGLYLYLDENCEQGQTENINALMHIRTEFEKLRAELAKEKAISEKLETNLSVCKNDYWFMVNLIEKYSTNKDQTLKDCLERMKFREPLFNALKEVKEMRG